MQSLANEGRPDCVIIDSQIDTSDLYIKVSSLYKEYFEAGLSEKLKKLP